MKFLVCTLVSIAMALSANAQSSFDHELEELIGTLGLSTKKLMELESVRTSIKPGDERNRSEWAAKYAKWDPENKTNDLNLAKIILTHTPFEEIGSSDFRGYGNEYLAYAIDNIVASKDNSINDLNAAFLRNTLLHAKEDRNIIQSDIKLILQKIDESQKKTPYSTRDFRKMTDYVWKYNPELISADFAEVVKVVLNYSEQDIMKFANFFEAQDMNLLGLYSLPSFEKSRVESGNAKSFASKLKSSYDLSTFVKTNFVSKNADKWAPYEFEKYKVFTDNDDVRNALLGLILLEKLKNVENEWFDNSLTGREFEKLTGVSASSYLLSIETATIDEMKLYMPIDLENRSYLEQLLMATENEIYFILPAENRFMSTIGEIDVLTFDLTEEERAIVLEMQIPRGVGYEGSVLLRKDGVVQRLENSSAFRLAACVLLAQNALKVTTNWYNVPTNLNPFNVNSAAPLETMETKTIRVQKQDEVYGQLRKVLLDNGNISNNYIIVYSSNGQIRVSPNVASKVKGQMRSLLESAGIDDERFHGIPSYARFSIEMKLTAQEIEELGEIELQIQNIAPTPKEN
jgi:hypothetical protein